MESINYIHEAIKNSRASHNKFELNEMCRILRNHLDPAVIVEIGVHKGYSLEVWRKVFEPAILIGIDNDITPLDYKEAEIIEGNSQDPKVVKKVVEALKDYQIDFLFIDGDHTYTAARADYELYSPLVKKGGIIGIHDINRVGEQYNGSVETARLFDELKQGHEFKYVVDMVGQDGDAKDAPGIGLILV